MQEIFKCLRGQKYTFLSDPTRGFKSYSVQDLDIQIRKSGVSFLYIQSFNEGNSGEGTDNVRKTFFLASSVFAYERQFLETDLSTFLLFTSN